MKLYPPENWTRTWDWLCERLEPSELSGQELVILWETKLGRYGRDRRLGAVASLAGGYVSTFNNLSASEGAALEYLIREYTEELRDFVERH